VSRQTTERTTTSREQDQQPGTAGINPGSRRSISDPQSACVASSSTRRTSIVGGSHRVSLLRCSGRTRCSVDVGASYPQLKSQFLTEATEDYLPGAFSGAASGYGLARDLSPRPARRQQLLRSPHLAGSLQLNDGLPYRSEHASLNDRRGSRGCREAGSPYPRLQRKFVLTCPSGKNS
jgi:hypothetical protein